jgi:hypothetical protein
MPRSGTPLLLYSDESSPFETLPSQLEALSLNTQSPNPESDREEKRNTRKAVDIWPFFNKEEKGQPPQPRVCKFCL